MRYRLFVLTFIISFNGLAIEMTDLYQAQVRVSSQATNERKSALSKAFAQVLVKVGGKQAVVEHDEMKKSLNKTNQFLSQYRYLRKNNDLFLQAEFDEDKVNQLFQQAQLPIWGSRRPQVVLWFVEESGLERQILSDSEQQNLTAQIRDHSRTRGLPLILPLMDLTDQQSVDQVDIWGRFAEPVKLASQRYLADATIIIRLSNNTLLPVVNAEQSTEPQPVGYSNQNIGEQNCNPICESASYGLDWSLISQSQDFGQEYFGHDKSSLLRQALNDITDSIYQVHAINTEFDGSNELFIDVANVDSMKTYVQVSKFLTTLSSVADVQLEQVNGNNRRFKLALLGSRQTFIQALTLDKRLQEQRDPLAPVEENSVPVFYWIN